MLQVIETLTPAIVRQLEMTRTPTKYVICSPQAIPLLPYGCLLQARDTRTFRFPDCVFHYFDLADVYRGNYSKTKFLYLERTHIDNMVTRMGLRPLIAEKWWLQEWLHSIFEIPFDKGQPHKKRVGMLELMYQGIRNVYAAAHIEPGVNTIIHLPAGQAELFNKQYAMFNHEAAVRNHTLVKRPLPRGSRVRCVISAQHGFCK